MRTRFAALHFREALLRRVRERPELALLRRNLWRFRLGERPIDWIRDLNSVAQMTAVDPLAQNPDLAVGERLSGAGGGMAMARYFAHQHACIRLALDDNRPAGTALRSEASVSKIEAGHRLARRRGTAHSGR